MNSRSVVGDSHRSDIFTDPLRCSVRGAPFLEPTSRNRLAMSSSGRNGVTAVPLALSMRGDG